MRRAVVFLVVSALAAGHGHAEPPVHRWLVQAGEFSDDLSANQRRNIEQMLSRNQLHGSQSLASLQDSMFGLDWPLLASTNFTGFDYHGVSNFVDHDLRFPGFLQDYTCGTRTYDNANGYNHAGTDYFLWPFPWLMMDQEQVAIIAAAPGKIIGKTDGNFDRSCAMGDAEWNAVYVQHADNTVAWYGHMKSGSLTAKPIGAIVASGEFLGFVGSSGSSSAPHLHFELHASNGTILDPRHGQCNTAPELWAVSQAYEAPSINSLSTHSAEPQGVACGTDNGVAVEETPAYKDVFQPGEVVWVFASYHDQRNGELTHFSMLSPGRNLWHEWDFDMASESLPKPFYSGTGWDWSFTLPPEAPNGIWTVIANFQGKTVEHVFTVGPAVQRDIAAENEERARIAYLVGLCRRMNDKPPTCDGKRHP